jgi:hypothetical protein
MTDQAETMAAKLDALSIRDELAWQAFVHALLVTNRRLEAFPEHAAIAYRAADAFLAERAQQATPEAKP